MRQRFTVFVAIGCALFFLSAADTSYFARTRPITANPQLPTNYFVVDEEILQHARPDLGDLRIYDGATQVPYALAAQSGGVQSAEHEAKILNLGVMGGSTEFDLDLTETVQYNRVRLHLDAKDFLVTARISGKDALSVGKTVDLGTSTLYDFSREDLGSNFALKLPTGSFRYLHVRLTAGIRPEQVKGASVFSLEEKKTYWTDVGSCSSPAKVASGKDTLIACDLPESVPVDRILFSIAAGQVNFRRSVRVNSQDEGGSRQMAVGEISRVQMKRGGAVVDSEQLSIGVIWPHSPHFELVIANGDDAPLRLERVQPQVVERRAFFEPKNAATLHLYYGDGKLESPSYDYAKFFKDSEPAVAASLGAPEANAAFTGRPDDRPWSERHPAVLWIAMVAAVAGLGLLALRGLKKG